MHLPVILASNPVWGLPGGVESLGVLDFLAGLSISLDDVGFFRAVDKPQNIMSINTIKAIKARHAVSLKG